MVPVSWSLCHMFLTKFCFYCKKLKEKSTSADFAKIFAKIFAKFSSVSFTFRRNFRENTNTNSSNFMPP